MSVSLEFNRREGRNFSLHVQHKDVCNLHNCGYAIHSGDDCKNHVTTYYSRDDIIQLAIDIISNLDESGCEAVSVGSATCQPSNN